jgi:IMP dehydrogenase
MCLYISNKYPQILLIAGNVATGSAAKRLWQVGADIVKVGVGPGSLCTTRIETGNGVPQLTALMDVYTAKKDLEKELYNKTAKKTNNIEWLTTDQLAQSNIIKIRKLMIMADGGIKSAGDIVKALCFADLVMIGNMFAGTEESPGTTIIRDGIAYKEYVGSSTHKTNHIEGVEAIVPYKGKFTDILTKILEGIKSGCSYQGVSSLLELREDPQFIRITNAGLKESNHHDVRVI